LAEKDNVYKGKNILSHRVFPVTKVKDFQYQKEDTSQRKTIYRLSEKVSLQKHLAISPQTRQQMHVYFTTA